MSSPRIYDIRTSTDAPGVPVSIVVRTIARHAYLKECLASLARQDHKNLEAIVVNDGRAPLLDFLKDLGPSFPCTLIELPDSWGRSESANIALQHARGKYVGFLDDDDIYYPFHLSTLVTCLESSDYVVAYTDALRATQIPSPFDQDRYSTIDLSLAYSRDFDLAVLLQENYIPILCALFERRCLSEELSFDLNLDVLEDWDFWIQLAKRFPFHHIQQITCEYRARADLTNTVGNFEGLWEWSRHYVRSKHAR